MLAQEPNLQFAGTKHIAHHQIIGAVVSQLVGPLREFTAMGDDDLMRVEQTR